MRMRTAVAIVAASGVVLAGCGMPKVNTGTVSPASAGESSASAGEQTPTPTWGQRYTWKSGLAIEVAPPVACQPSSWASPQNVERAVKVKFTIVNGTGKPYEAAGLAFGNDVQFSGAKAEPVFDSEGACGGGGLDAATVLPDKTYTYEQAYAVGKEKGELQIALQPDFSSDKAVYVGQA
ncbi:hypothetical protein [Amycolatopsis sp. Hca4]|uniref:hypothetical protein n=1 Tax=Amycolatopsis sp. Hca4 TaxID=2742131 RepID=UPI001590ADA5|nr:hypothetical protein [Amycolatopsis sp. Hca4]QKV73423.1 hypothetical protein HUT10_06220 [Amycolatopsis sp. Hca4]